MYNSANEIIWLLNLLLQNDNRPSIYANEVFNKYGKLNEDGAGRVMIGSCTVTLDEVT